MKPLFPLGRVFVTPGVQQAIPNQDCVLFRLLGYHQSGYFGDDLCEEDVQANQDAIQNGDRILSVYEVNDVRVYIITESDRSVTTILLPSEY